MTSINFSLDGSPSKDVACEAIVCLNSETLTLYFSGLEEDVLSFIASKIFCLETDKQL